MQGLITAEKITGENIVCTQDSIMPALADRQPACAMPMTFLS